jgi:regulator of protease activity HflC (stomatin/prohibitin superfamily)
MLNIPSGPFVLYQRWNADQGELKPGVKWVWKPWYRISHVVTKSVISYNAPAKNCPTAENIMVDVDLSLTFQIGPDVEDAQKFVYRLGAHRLDELISAEVEEGIRGLVYSVTYDKVSDLREELALDMFTTLNNKISTFYGVRCLNVKITDVRLPVDLQNRLEKTTAFKTKLSEQEKTHENRVRVLDDEATKELETIRKTNSRNIQIIEAENARFKLERQIMEERARGDALTQEIQATELAKISLLQAEGEEVVEVEKARQNAEALLNKAKMESQKIKIDADQLAKVMKTLAEAHLEVAELQSVTMITAAEAEAEGADALAEKRRYELEWARLAVLKKIAGNGRRFITGEKGDALLNELIPATRI